MLRYRLLILIIIFGVFPFMGKSQNANLDLNREYSLPVFANLNTDSVRVHHGFRPFLEGDVNRSLIGVSFSSKEVGWFKKSLFHHNFPLKNNRHQQDHLHA